MRSMKALAVATVAALAYAEEEAAAEVAKGEIPATADGAFFFEPFLATWEDTWKVSKDADFSGRWKLETYGNDANMPGDKGLVVSDPARKHAVSTLFKKPFVPETGGLVVQYELQLKNGLTCGGAYLKLLTSTAALDADGFKAETPYTLMFGPDKCGDTNKVHFILRHKNPKSGEWEEKHLQSPPIPLADKETHLYTAIVGTDNSVKILVDNKEMKTASLTSDTDFKPAVNPPKEIDDPEDFKPEDWVDEAKIDEPGAAKPADWDEDAPRQIPDPDKSKPDDWLDDAPDMVPDSAAAMPDDWDADEDGDWEAPLIANPDCKEHGCGEWKAPMVTNPEYKGKWFAPKIDNPDYKGVWAPRKIDNPNYFEDAKPYAMAPIGGIGIELWTMQDGILFDNILIADSASVASDLAAKTFVVRKAAETAAKKTVGRDMSKEDGFLGTVKYYAKQAYYFTIDNMLLVGGSLCLGLIPLILLCCCTGGKKKDEDDDNDDDEPPVAAPSKAAGKAKAAASTPAADEDEDEDEGEGEKDEDEAEAPAPEEPKASGSKATKRKTKKASD